MVVAVESALLDYAIYMETIDGYTSGYGKGG